MNLSNWNYLKNSKVLTKLIYDTYNDIQLKIEVIDQAPDGDRETFENDYGNFEGQILNAMHELKKPRT